MEDNDDDLCVGDDDDVDDFDDNYDAVGGDVDLYDDHEH